MPTESQTELVLDGIASQLLASIQQARGYHFNALDVLRPDNYMEWDSEHVFDKTDQIIGTTAFFSVRAGDETIREETSGGTESELEVFLLGATLHTPASIQPRGAVDPIMQTVQERLRKDILKAIFEDVRVGGHAFNAEPVMVGRGLYLEDWAIIEVMLTVHISGRFEDP
jgi:hypothetical protein